MKKNKLNQKIPVANLENGLPTLAEACKNLKNLIDTNNHRGSHKERIIKIIHGYGSSDAGGGILRSGLARYLTEIKQSGQIRNFINGEYFRKGNRDTNDVCEIYPYLMDDQDFGRDNWGITIIIFNK